MHAPELYGLILTGGKSSRMGRDKALMNYQGEPQGRYCQRLLKSFCRQVFLSCRKAQWETPEYRDTFSDFPVVLDTHEDIGPMAGLLSAMEQYPQVAWLVLACDMPQVNQTLLEKLVASRSPSHLATVFTRPRQRSMPMFEPLCAIYEPACLDYLCQAFEKEDYGLQFWLNTMGTPGKICPVELLLPEAALLMSLNTPEEVRYFERGDRPDQHMP
jgi:molybdopterin-guanine dinucleotide biosynthesis protein A